MNETVFVVNELNEIDSTYNVCHIASFDKDKALEKFNEVVNRAKLDIGDYKTNEFEDCVQIYNDNYSISVNIDEVKII